MRSEDNLRRDAREYAAIAYREIRSDPWGYGIWEPWDSVDQWISFEMDGAAGDEFPTKEERAAVESALRALADLDDLNAPFSRNRVL